jgi:hypothetical protein
MIPTAARSCRLARALRWRLVAPAEHDAITTARLVENRLSLFTGCSRPQTGRRAVFWETTPFGTRGSQVQILPLRPILSWIPKTAARQFPRQILRRTRALHREGRSRPEARRFSGSTFTAVRRPTAIGSNLEVRCKRERQRD